MRIFDKKQWKKIISLDSHWPDWLCSECQKGYLHPVIDSSVIELKTESSVIKYLRHNEPGLDADNHYFYTAIKVECNNLKCSSESLLTGKRTCGERDYIDEYGRQNRDYIEFFEPIFFTIPPQVIAIPKVNDEDKKFHEGVKFLYQSFKIFFDDPSSAANKVRIFLEYLTPKTDEEDKRSLDKRLKDFLEEANPHILELLKASKWIGNDASHEGDITHEDVLESYEFIEYALSLMYPEDRDRSTLLHKAGNINTNKKPSSKIN